ncbi:MAG: hypothetical protein AB7S38_19565 [Vulcanimicrobiota bacterium]
MDSFLEQQGLSPTTGQSVFGIDQERASALFLEALSTSPEFYLAHLLSCAYLLGARTMRVRNRAAGWVRLEELTGIHFGGMEHAVEFEVDPPTLENLEGHLLSRKDSALHRLALAVYCASHLRPRRIVVETASERFCWSPRGQSHQRRQAKVEGLRFTLEKAGKFGSPAAWGKQPTSRDEANLVLSWACRYSPVKVDSDTPLPDQQADDVAIIWRYWQRPDRPLAGPGQGYSSPLPYSVHARFDYTDRPGYLGLVVEGITYWLAFASLPRGLTVVANPDEVHLDSTRTELVENDRLLALLAELDSLAGSLLEAAARLEQRTGLAPLLAQAAQRPGLALLRDRAGQPRPFSRSGLGYLDTEAILPEDLALEPAWRRQHPRYYFESGFPAGYPLMCAGPNQLVVGRRVVEVESGRTLFLLPPFEQAYGHPEGTYLALLDGATLRVFEQATGHLVQTFEDVASAIFASATLILSHPGRLTLWSLEDHASQEIPLEHQVAEFLGLAATTLCYRVGENLFTLALGGLQTREHVPWLVDLSPDGQWLALQTHGTPDPIRITNARTGAVLAKLAGPEGRFSWDSDSFYFYDAEDQAWVYRLRGQTARAEAKRPTTLSRLGFDQEWGANAQLVLEVSPRQTFVLMERKFWRKADSFEPLWGLVQAELVNAPEWFAWSDGQGVFWVSYQDGRIEPLPEAWIDDGVLLRKRALGWELFDPATGQSGCAVPDRARLRLNDDRTLVFATRNRRTEVLSLATGQRLTFIDQPLLGQLPEVGSCSQPHCLVDDSRTRYRAPEATAWEEETHIEDVHPREFKLLFRTDDGWVWLRRQAGDPLKLGRGTYARFSPAGTYCLVLDRRGARLTLHRTETAEIVAEFDEQHELLRGEQSYLEPFSWLSEMAIRFGSRQVWRAHPRLGWSRPQEFAGMAGVCSFRPKASPIEVRREAEGLEFWHVGRDERLGILYTSGQDWLFLSEDGRLEASPDARLFKSSRPENALARLVETDPPTCPGLFGSVLSQAARW